MVFRVCLPFNAMSRAMSDNVSHALKIRSWGGAVAFAAMLVGLAVVSATTLSYVMFPPEVVFVGVKNAFFITLIVAWPLCLFVAWIIKTNTNLAIDMETMLSRDRLTGLMTRNYFFDQLSKMPERQGVTLLIDLDHFADFNDEHGHLVGDQALEHVAAQIAGELRSRDIACRFGGEEFVLFLDQIGPDQARNMAERLRLNIARNPLEIEGKTFPVTVSIGASFRHDASQIKTALTEAEQSLSQAKAQGRNRTILATKGNAARPTTPIASFA